MAAGAAVSEDLTGAGGSVSRWLTHSTIGRKACREPRLLAAGTFPYGYLGDYIARHLASPRKRGGKEEQGSKKEIFYDLVSEVTGLPRWH